MAVGTPFHSRTAPLCTSLRFKQWSGYFAADAYDDFHDPEYHAIRSGAGLIDVSPLYKYDLKGPDALRLVDRVITRNARRCDVGQVLYSGWCDEDGKLLQDGCFQRLEENLFRATAAEPALAWFRLNATGMDVDIEEVSENYGALATVDRGYETPGTSLDLEYTVEYVHRRAAAKVVPLPFFDPERKRSVP